MMTEARKASPITTPSIRRRRLLVALGLLLAITMPGITSAQRALDPEHLGARRVPPGGRVRLTLEMLGAGDTADVILVAPADIRVTPVQRTKDRHEIELTLQDTVSGLGRARITVRDTSVKRSFTLDLVAERPAIDSAMITLAGGPRVNAVVVPDVNQARYNVILHGGPFHYTDSVWMSDPNLRVEAGPTVVRDFPKRLSLQLGVLATSPPAIGMAQIFVGGPTRIGVSSWAVEIKSESPPLIIRVSPDSVSTGREATVVFMGRNLHPGRVAAFVGGRRFGDWKVLSATTVEVTAHGSTPNADGPLALVLENRDGRSDTATVQVGSQIGQINLVPEGLPRLYADTTMHVRVRRQSDRPPFQPTDNYRLILDSVQVDARLTYIDGATLQGTLRLPAERFPSSKNPASISLVLASGQKRWTGVAELTYRPRVNAVNQVALYPGGRAGLFVAGSNLEGATLRPAGQLGIAIKVSDQGRIHAELDAADDVIPGDVAVEVVKDGAVFDKFTVAVASRPRLSFVRAQLGNAGRPMPVDSFRVDHVNRGDRILLTLSGDSLPAGLGKQTVVVHLLPDSGQTPVFDATTTVRPGERSQLYVRVPSSLPSGRDALLVVKHATGEQRSVGILPVRKTSLERLQVTIGAAVARWKINDVGSSSTLGDVFLGPWYDLSPIERPVGVGAHLLLLKQETGGPRVGWGFGLHIDKISMIFGLERDVAVPTDTTAAAADAQDKRKSAWYFMLGGSISTDVRNLLGLDKEDK